MKSLEKHKTTIFALIIFFIGIMMYKTFFKVDSAVTTQSESAQNVGSDLVEMYNRLEQVSLDQKLFSLPAYQALQDFSIALFPQPTGRQNPFEILGK